MGGFLLPYLETRIFKNPTINDFKEYIYVGYIFHWSHFWTNSFDLEALLTTCECPDYILAVTLCGLGLVNSSNGCLSLVNHNSDLSDIHVYTKCF